MLPGTRLFAAASCVLALSCATAQTWRGKIIDCKTTQPIADADVEITVSPSDAPHSGKTGSDGSFTFSAPGATQDATAALTVSKRGYQATQASLGAPPGSASPICMPPTR